MRGRSVAGRLVVNIYIITLISYTPLRYKRVKTTQNKTTLDKLPVYDTRPGNKVGLFYNAPEPTRGRKNQFTDISALSSWLLKILWLHFHQRPTSL